MEKMRQWLVLTAVGTVAVLVAGWFLLVSPQGKHTAQLHQQADSQRAANATIQAQVNQLQAQRADLPRQQKKLDEVAAKIPDNPALPTLIRELSTAANTAGVDLVSLAPSTPVVVAAPAPVAPAPAPGTGTASGTAGGAVPSAVHTVPVTLAQIALQVQVQGSYFNIESFFASIESLRRAMLVTQFTLSPASGSGGGSAAGASGSKGSAPGALTAQIQAVVFESPSVVAPVTTPVAPSATSGSAAPANSEK